MDGGANQPWKSTYVFVSVTYPSACQTIFNKWRAVCDAAISMWTSSGDSDHAYIVGAYFHYSVPGGYTEPEAIDISPKRGLFGGGDPMYVVTAKKKA